MALPRTDAQRIAKYIAKVVPTTVGLKFAAMLANMKSGFAGKMSGVLGLVETQLLVNGELAQLPTILPLTFGMYHAYGNELWKLRNTIGQPSLDAAAQVIKTKWTTRGADGPSLITIAFNVFNITVT